MHHTNTSNYTESVRLKAQATYYTVLYLILPHGFTDDSEQRVLNDLLRTRLSRCRMIWLLLHILPLSPVGKLTIFLSLPVRSRSSLLTGRRGDGQDMGGGEAPYDGEKAWSVRKVEVWI